MSAASCLLNEDQFLCSICLDVFTEPVTTPCGHNFCKDCITTHWGVTFPCECPYCKKLFFTLPELHVNIFVSEMAAQFRHTVQQEATASEQLAAKPGEVPCDVCTGARPKALKSCLVCLVSLCGPHLEPHRAAAALRRHQLVEPVENLEARVCRKHNKLLEMFCRTDQTFVCTLCTASDQDHKTHDAVPLEEEYDDQKVKMKQTEAELHHMIRTRRQKIDEIKQSVELSEKAADREIDDGLQVFGALKEFVARSEAEFVDSVTETQKKIQKDSEVFVKSLEREVSELEKRRGDLEELSRSMDRLEVLQNFMSLNASPPPPPLSATTDWTQVDVRPPSYDGTAVRAAARLEETLGERTRELVAEAELKRARRSAVDVTLDPDTAHPKLVLSDDRKQVRHGDVRKDLPDDPKRFDDCINVLAAQSFSSGRFYYEVLVKGKTKWVLGVAAATVDRKGEVTASPQNGYWAIWLRNDDEYKALAHPEVRLGLGSRPETVGVFVDYEAGLVSFYDVGAAALIYAFTGCSFTQKLHPLFSPGFSDGGKNAAPLIITPVRHTE